MKVSLNSIAQLTEIKIPKEELISKVFTQIGAVEEIEDLAKKYEGILIVKIEKKEPHPDSDRLAIYQINIGESTTQVVAGDLTLEVGDTVAYFKPGTKLPYNARPEKNENVVSKVKLRGIDSDGMLASQKELDFGSDHTIVMRFDNSLNAGTTLVDAFNLDDTILDIENKALANRGDCFGLIGIAREIAAIQGSKFESPKWYIDQESNSVKGSNDYVLKVDNQTQILCPRYTSVILKGVKVGNSPQWMQIELIKHGIKPINNVVDITNYLMILTSQPLHAFDMDKLEKGINGEVNIVVRQAQDGEKLHALNDKVLELDSSMTVIADSKNPIALAGIIGGMNTQVDENSINIVLEVANFNRYNIRKTSWKVGVATDAATRFTKAISTDQCMPVLYQAVKLISELAGGEVASEVIDSYPTPKAKQTLKINLEKLNTFLGLNLTTSEVSTILSNIEYPVIDSNELEMTIEVPFFREDINIVEDIYEDIARIYGFNNIPITYPTRVITPIKPNTLLKIKTDVRDIVANSGANEILTYNFVSSKDITSFNLSLDDAYHLKNSLSPELEFMRINTIPSIALKLKENVDKGYTVQTLFEINMGHNKQERDEMNLPIERWNVSLLTTNANSDTYSSYYNAKAYLSRIEKVLNLQTLEYTLVSDVQTSDLPVWINISIPMYEPNRSAVISYTQNSKKYYVGIIGEISQLVISKNTLPKDLSGFELDLHQLINAVSPISRYQEPSKYPKISQDLCFKLNIDIQYGTMVEELSNLLKGSKLYFDIDLVDIYIPQGEEVYKNVTFTLTLQSRDKTLENWEFESVKKKIVYIMNEKFSAQLI